MRFQLQSITKTLRAAALATLQGAAAGTVVLMTLYPAGLQSGTLAAGWSALASAESKSRPPVLSRVANFGNAHPSVEAKTVADWVARVDDSQGKAFVVIDKKSAHLYVFDAHAQLQASSPVLLGAALGDESVPGIGDRPIEEVRPHERTTPAGRFVGERGRNARGEDVVWVDYDAAVSMHRVVTSNAAEQRLRRLATPSVSDNRISYGCINIPPAFYDAYIRPAFATQSSIVYVLPDVARIQQFFGV